MRVIRTLNEQNFSRIRTEFAAILFEKRIPYVKTGVFLDGDKIVFLIEQEKGKVIVMKGQAKWLIGLTPQLIATDYANCLLSQISG